MLPSTSQVDSVKKETEKVMEDKNSMSQIYAEAKHGENDRNEELKKEAENHRLLRLKNEAELKFKRAKFEKEKYFSNITLLGLKIE
jgi:uncharacterized protein YaaN involved in tellurite resistance